MRLLLLGDVHGYFMEIRNNIKTLDYDYALQVGDMVSYGYADKPFYFIAGNHENWSVIDCMDNGRLELPNLRHIKTAETIGLEKDNELIKISGINGNFGHKSYNMSLEMRNKRTGKKRSHFVKEEVDQCKSLKNIDIFLSHECPNNIGYLREDRDLGEEAIREILDELKPKVFLFGHHHKHYETMIDDTKVIGLGYPTREHCILDTSDYSMERTVYEESLLGGNRFI